MRLFLILIISLPTYLTAQYVSVKHADDFPLVRQKKVDIHRVLNRDTLVFFGVDFSNAVIHDESIEKKGINVLETIPLWIERYYSDWVQNTGRTSMEKMFDKEVVLAKENIQESYKERPINAFNDPAIELELNDIQRIISDYPKTDQGEVGFVIILERLDSENDQIKGHFTFFTTDSHKILWTLYMQASERGGEFGLRWGASLSRMMKHFKDVYKQVG